MNEISNHPTARLSEKLYCGGGGDRGREPGRIGGGRGTGGGREKGGKREFIDGGMRE